MAESLLETAHSFQETGSCLLAEHRASMAEGQAEELDFMLRHPGKYSSRLIARVLTRHGFDISKDTVRKHVNGDCPCLS